MDAWVFACGVFMWCLIYPEVCLNLPLVLAAYPFSLNVGSLLSSKIYDGHFVSRLTHSYGVDIGGMIQLGHKDLDERFLMQMCVIMCGVDRIFRIPTDDRWTLGLHHVDISEIGMYQRTINKGLS